jgi:hypothetical protein
MVPLSIEIPIELDRQLRDWLDHTGKKLADEVRLAIRRHLKSPLTPDEEVPPLPPPPTPK